MQNSILENTPPLSEGSKPKRKPQPHGAMDYSEAGRERNLILRSSKIWVDLDPSAPCMANGRRKGIKGIHACVMETMEERIAFYFQHVQVDEKGCWVWTRNNCFDGYGRICFLGRDWKVNRFIWYAHFGSDPGKSNVLHTCDNRLCGNPDHLFLGTKRDNSRDMRKKLRGVYVYSPEKVLMAKELRKQGMIYKNIQAITGIPHNHVGKICRGEVWDYVDKEYVERVPDIIATHAA